MALLWWLKVSHLQNPNTNMQAAQAGRERYCKQTPRWQDVTQIYLQGPLNCSLLTERRPNKQIQPVTCQACMFDIKTHL